MKRILYLLLIFVFHTQLRGQIYNSCTIIFHDSVTHKVRYQFSNDTVKMYFANNWRRVDNIINIPVSTHNYPKTIIENDSISYYYYALHDTLTFFKKKDKLFPYSMDIISVNVVPTLEQKLIAGYDCKKYIVYLNLRTGYTLTRYYWITDGFEIGNWPLFTLNEIKGCPLQIDSIIETKQGKYLYTNVMYAIKVSFEELDKELFDVRHIKNAIPASLEQFKKLYKNN